MRDPRTRWKRSGEAWRAWLGNNLYAVCEPNAFADNRTRYWTYSVQVGSGAIVRGGTMGDTRRTLAAAKLAAMAEAECVGRAITDIVGEHRAARSS